MELAQWLHHANASCEDAAEWTRAAGGHHGHGSLGPGTLQRTGEAGPGGRRSSPLRAAMFRSGSFPGLAGLAGGDAPGGPERDGVMARMFEPDWRGPDEGPDAGPWGAPPPAPVPLRAQGSGVSKFASVDTEAGAVEERVAAKQLHASLAATVAQLERAVAFLAARRGRGAGGDAGEAGAAEDRVSGLCKDLSSHLWGVEDGAASRALLDQHRGVPLAVGLLRVAGPRTGDGVSAVVKTLAVDCPDFVHLLCAHGGLPALADGCGPEHGLPARRRYLTVLAKAVGHPATRRLAAAGGAPVAVGRLLRQPLLPGEGDRVPAYLAGYLGDALDVVWRLLEDPAPVSLAHMCRQLAEAGVVLELCRAVDFCARAVGGAGGDPGRARWGELCAAALQALQVLAHADYATRLQFCEAAAADALLGRCLDSRWLPGDLRTQVVRTVRVAASFEPARAGGYAGPDPDEGGFRIGALLGATSALQSLVMVVNDALVPRADGEGRGAAQTELLYEAMCALSLMLRGHKGHQETAARFSLSNVLCELADGRAREVLSSAPADRGPDDYETDDAGARALTQGARARRTAGTAMALLCSLMTGSAETRRLIRDGGGGVSGRALEVVLSALGEREWEREVFTVVLVWLGDAAGVVEPKLERRDAELVGLLDPARYVLPGGDALDVKRLTEVLEPFERLLLRCKRVSERLVSRRLPAVVGHLCGYFSPRLARRTTAIVRRMLVKVLEALYEMAPGGEKARFLVDGRLNDVLRGLAQSPDPNDAVVREQAMQLLDAFRISEVL